MDHDLAIYGNAIYFDDSCLIERWPEVSGPTKVYQLDPDCPEDLRADFGVDYNPPQYIVASGLKKGGTLTFKNFPGIDEKKPFKITNIDAEGTISLEDVPF